MWEDVGKVSWGWVLLKSLVRCAAGHFSVVASMSWRWLLLKLTKVALFPSFCFSFCLLWCIISPCLGHNRKIQNGSHISGACRLSVASIYDFKLLPKGYLIIGVQTTVLVSSNTGALQVFSYFGSGKLVPWRSFNILGVSYGHLFHFGIP